MSTTAAAELPPVRRIITGHTSDGKAIYADDGPVRSYPFAGSTTLFTHLYRSDGLPSSNDGGFEDAAKHRENELVNPNGSVLRAVDFPPRTESVGVNAYCRRSVAGLTGSSRFSTVRSHLTTASSSAVPLPWYSTITNALL